MQRSDFTAHVEKPRRRGLAVRRDELVLKLCRRALAHVPHGRLTIALPSGRSGVVCDGASARDLDLRFEVVKFRVFWKSLWRGSIGFAASYIDGSIETDDLAGLFRFFLKNKPALAEAGRGWFRVRALDKTAHWLRRNSPRGSRANIVAHYDLGNDFYARWLDSGMTYSSGIFGDAGASLEEAQEEKYDRIIDALALGPEMSVLEIGCGWGGMAERLAGAGALVDAVTLSHEQLAHTRSRIAAAGLAGKANINLRDYRDTSGNYDRIVSIEMIEAVGEENWQVYFDTLAARLKPGGHAVVQAITIEPELFAAYRSKADFIQRYIFPGGMLPTEAAMQRHAAAAGLNCESIERFGGSYAKTVREWRRRFLDAWPDLEAMGFDQRFRRKWIYYLTYCEVGFELEATNVGIYRFTRNHQAGV